MISVAAELAGHAPADAAHLRDARADHAQALAEEHAPLLGRGRRAPAPDPGADHRAGHEPGRRREGVRARGARSRGCGGGCATSSARPSGSSRSSSDEIERVRALVQGRARAATSRPARRSCRADEPACGSDPRRASLSARRARDWRRSPIGAILAEGRARAEPTSGRSSQRFAAPRRDRRWCVAVLLTGGDDDAEPTRPAPRPSASRSRPTTGPTRSPSPPTSAASDRVRRGLGPVRRHRLGPRLRPRAADPTRCAARPDRLREWARVLDVRPDRRGRGALHPQAAAGHAHARHAGDQPLVRRRPAVALPGDPPGRHRGARGQGRQAGGALPLRQPAARADLHRDRQVLRLPAQLPARRPPCEYLDFDDGDYAATTTTSSCAIDAGDYRDACYLPYPDPPAVRPKTRAAPRPPSRRRTRRRRSRRRAARRTTRTRCSCPGSRPIAR